MRRFHWNLFCLMVLGLASVLAEEVTLENDLKSIDEPNDSEKEEVKAGAATSIDVSESDKDDTKLDTETSRRAYEEDDTSEEARRAFPGFLMDKNMLNKFKSAPKVKLYDQLSQLDQKVPRENEYKYNPINANQVLTYYGGQDSSGNQPLVSGAQNLNIQSQRSGNAEIPMDSGIPEPYSRAIPYNERIRLHEVPGASFLVSCSSEGELHNVWTYEYQCLVCVCIRESGLLRPVCASCSGCTAPNNNIIEYTTPWRPDEPVTSLPIPYEDEVTCKPLPVGQPFENPLHPCQVCVCTESITAYGKPDVNIQCEENPQCVLPADATMIPIIPDVPVPSPYCEKFPLNVLFPHPLDTCKTCRCTEQLTQGIMDKVLICLPNPSCRTEAEIITEVPIYPITISAEPIYEIDTIKPWTPATAAPPPPGALRGPLPGPSPHDSCQPYIPNQAFQHPWDECQMCVCTEAFAKSLITVEISCFTKKSCCVEPPYEVVIPATLPPAPYKPSEKLIFQDAICEYKTFGVEFAHPKDPCDVCSCEPQGQFITLLCKRSSKPECQLMPAFPTVPIYPTVPATLSSMIQGVTNLPSNSINLYNTGSVSPQANKNQFISNQIPFGAGQATGQAGQWNHQNYQRPGAFGLNSQNNNQFRYNARSDDSNGHNIERLGASKLYEPQYKVQGLGYSNQGYHGAYGQNYYPGAAQYDAYPQSYTGNQPGLRPKEYSSQSQASASATSAASAAAQSNAFGYSGYPYLGYPGGPMRPGANAAQYAHSSASAQSQAQSSGHASAQSSARVQMRSGNPDEEKIAEKEE